MLVEPHMQFRLHQMMQLGDLIAAAYEEAERVSSDPHEVSRLATGAIENMLRAARRVPRYIPARAPDGMLRIKQKGNQ
jgi:hypothetical protein